MDKQKTTDRGAFHEVRRWRSCLNAGIGGAVVVGTMWASAIGTKTQTHAQGVAGFQEYRVIVEKNIFNPRRGVARAQEKAEPKSSPVSAMLMEIKVVGIVLRDDSRSSLAIVEEGGRQRMCRVGDTVGAMVIRDIRRNELVLEAPGGQWVAEIQSGTMGRRVVQPPSQRASVAAVPRRRSLRGPVGVRLPIKATEIPHLARTVGLAIDAHEGDAEGLRLNRDFLGLKEGDRVTHVGRQALGTGHPRQKLWQIARKYSAYGRAMPEIPILVERGGTELEFVLSPSM